VKPGNVNHIQDQVRPSKAQRIALLILDLLNLLLAILGYSEAIVPSLLNTMDLGTIPHRLLYQRSATRHIYIQELPV
jgi:hypothetical protein